MDCLSSSRILGAWLYTPVLSPFVFCVYLRICLFVCDPHPMASWSQLIVLGLIPNTRPVRFPVFLSLIDGPKNGKSDKERKSLWWINVRYTAQGCDGHCHPNRGSYFWLFLKPITSLPFQKFGFFSLGFL